MYIEAMSNLAISEYSLREDYKISRTTLIYTIFPSLFYFEL